MEDNERDGTSLLSAAPRTRSASMSILSSSSVGSSKDGTRHVGHSGPLPRERSQNHIRLNQRTRQKYPSLGVRIQSDRRHRDDSHAGKNEHLLRSGQLGMCDDPYCTTCPTNYISKEAKRETKTKLGRFDPFYNALYGDAKGWAKRIPSHIYGCVPGIMNPHTKVVQRWNRFFVISWLVAVFVDPLFFFLPGMRTDDKCISMDNTMTMALVVIRSVTDLIYVMYILLQFRLAYIAPESTVVGAGDLIDDPKQIALHYLKGYFLVDLFVALPIPQIMVLLARLRFEGASAAGYAKNLFRIMIYVPRLGRLLHMLATTTGFIFESAWANFAINLLTYVLFGHIIGSTWYLFGLQRVTRCLQDACRPFCEFMYCENGVSIDHLNNNNSREAWKNSTDVVRCFSGDNLNFYGIYLRTINLTTTDNMATRYFYSLFWGFQQISTLAGNQTPSYFVGEVVFTMSIIGLGLLLFALLIGNMQNFLQALGKRRLEMTLRRHDVELWMKHRRLPVKLRKRVRRSERYSWAATRGVDEEMLLNNLPEDLQKDIRRHLFTFEKKVKIFSLMDDAILNVICEKLRQKTYIKGSKILNRNGLIEKMFFIVRGKLQSKGDDGVTDLCEGDVCGEELLAWCLENSSVNKGKGMRVPGQRLHSYRTVKCLTNVEAFSLRAADLEEVTRIFPRFFRNPRVQGAIRYVSPYWRGLAAARIQVAWRYWKKRQSRANISQSGYPPM